LNLGEKKGGGTGQKGDRFEIEFDEETRTISRGGEK
jgi:hypothetical protein